MVPLVADGSVTCGPSKFTSVYKHTIPHHWRQPDVSVFKHIHCEFFMYATLTGRGMKIHQGPDACVKVHVESPDTASQHAPSRMHEGEVVTLSRYIFTEYEYIH